jgi:hypothetical protein
MYAVREKYNKSLKILLDYMIEFRENYLEILNLQDNCGRTALHIALLWRNFEAVKLLLAVGPDTCIVDFFGVSPRNLCPTLFDKGVKHTLQLILEIPVEKADSHMPTRNDVDNANGWFHSPNKRQSVKKSDNPILGAIQRLLHNNNACVNTRLQWYQKFLIHLRKISPSMAEVLDDMPQMNMWLPHWLGKFDNGDIYIQEESQFHYTFFDIGSSLRISNVTETTTLAVNFFLLLFLQLFNLYFNSGSKKISS